MNNFTNSKDFPFALSPVTIGRSTARNRIFFPPMSLHWANPDGSVSDKLMKFYSDLALGGCGMIVTGVAVVSEDSGAAAISGSGQKVDRRMRINDDKFIPGLQKLFREISWQGGLPSIQLYHTGRQAISPSGVIRIAPSALPCPLASQLDPEYAVREMTHEDIERIQGDFIAAACRAAEAGAAVIQLHAGHGFLLNQFLSPYSNVRTDQYGGNVKNRARFIVEIIESIRKNIGNDVAIDIRISADEFVDDGLVPSDYIKIIPLFEKAGIDMVSISFAVLPTMFDFLTRSKKEGIKLLDLVDDIKEIASVPVAYAGFIDSVNMAETILSEGRMDLVGMARALLADPSIIRKSVEGKEAGIRKCAGDNGCLFSLADPSRNTVNCTINPDYKYDA